MALDPNRWTLKTTEAFSRATGAARSASNPELVPEHLLVALLDQNEGIVQPLLHKVGIDPDQARLSAQAVLDRLPSAQGGSDPTISRDLRAVLDDASSLSDDLGDEYLSTEHLLLALADRLSIDKETLLTALRDVRGSHRVTSQNPENQYQALQRFGFDLTEAARLNELDPVIGRDDEIRRVDPSAVAPHKKQSGSDR